METRDAIPEELPPLELTKLRELDLREPPVAEQPAHLAAASGVVRRGDYVYVIGDDLLHVGLFRVATAEPGELRQVLEGELPDDQSAREKDKADLEALTALPPFEGAPHGGLLGLGSGSKEGRDRGFFCPFAADGSLDGEPRTIDFGPVYQRLRDELERINIEGAAVVGERLWLLHRGNKGPAPNAIAEFELADLAHSLSGDLVVDPDELATIRTYELGRLDEVPLCFSDATALSDDTIVFSASAEDDEGGTHGSVVGTIGRGGDVHRLRTIDRRWKVEGVHASIDTGVLDLLFVCDQDDPETPSPLLSATMPVEAAVEAASA
jgi:uncharacterized protein DUF6929